MDKARFGLFMLFWCSWILSLLGVYYYFKWCFDTELLTTAGIIGIIMSPLVVVAELLFSAFCLGAMNEILK